MITRQLINFQGNQFVLKQRILDDPKYTGDKLDILNIFYGSNKVLRKDGYLHFLEQIEDVEVIAWLPKED
jgi:hypothetical protein